MHALMTILAPLALASESIVADWRSTVCSSENNPGVPADDVRDGYRTGVPPEHCMTDSRYQGSKTSSPPINPSC